MFCSDCTGDVCGYSILGCISSGGGDGSGAFGVSLGYNCRRL